MVFVLSCDGQPLNPCHPARARQLLRRGRAVLVRRFPFTIRLIDRTAAQSTTNAYRIKCDPGSRTTGIVIMAEDSSRVVVAAELTHRSPQIHDALVERKRLRGHRRARKTRYRPARFANRRRTAGWLPPSVQSRVQHLHTWMTRLRQLCPLTAISLELVRFDTQLLENPDISGVGYQQGELMGYEVREYLLEQWERRCAYCGARGVPLQVEHMVPRSRGGTDRLSNLVIACGPCNLAKGNRTAAEFGFPAIQAQTKAPLRDTAAMNAMRWAVYRLLEATGLPLEVGTGGRTKYNRSRMGWAKTHWQDAACVGASTPDRLHVATPTVLRIVATGRGQHSRTRLNKHGFPRLRFPRQKRFFGFQTGDMAEVVVTRGKKQGRYVGRVAVRSNGRFNITTDAGTVESLHHRCFRLLQRADGYRYTLEVIQDSLHPNSAAEGKPHPHSSHR